MRISSRGVLRDQPLAPCHCSNDGSLFGDGASESTLPVGNHEQHEVFSNHLIRVSFAFDLLRACHEHIAVIVTHHAVEVRTSDSVIDLDHVVNWGTIV